MQRAENKCPRWREAGEVCPKVGETWVARGKEAGREVTIEFVVSFVSTDGRVFEGHKVTSKREFFRCGAGAILRRVR